MTDGEQALNYGNDGAASVARAAYVVPNSVEVRLQLRGMVHDYVAQEHLVAPLLMHDLETHADRIICEHDVDAVYREFLFILINNEVWTPVVGSIPFGRRTLMLPPCLRATATCAAEFDPLGLLCERCGGCMIGSLSEQAEDLGYTVIVAEGTTIVASLVEQGKVDAVIGVGCMAALERTFPRMVDAAVPGLAVPLLRDGCAETTVDGDWVQEAIRMGDGTGTGFCVPDLHGVYTAVQGWFEAAELREVCRHGDTEVERIAMEWLLRSGKRWRPFLTSCVALAVAGRRADEIPDAVRTAAIAMECIHKASLVYDDIQDGDDVRYGEPTLHTAQGVPVAMTVSLYLLGLGYRLLAECGGTDRQKVDMLQLAADGHCRLCLGQGRELMWTRTPSLLTAEAVLEICRMKTAPSFEVVLGLGAVCAGADADTRDIVKQYSEALGVAYQLRDDLDDFTAGGDVDDILAQRPSIVLAMGYEVATDVERSTIAAVWDGKVDKAGANEIREMIIRHGVEQRVKALADAYQEQALRALSPLRDQGLKLTLYRIARRVLGADV